MCNVCYREMRSDVLKRHIKQHSKKNESVPATNILKTNNIYNNPPSVSTSDPIKKSNKKSKINKEELRKHLIKVENEYQEKLELGKEIYEMLGEGVVPYQALTRDMKEAVNLYIEKQADFRDVGNVELKPWQNELMKYIQPHDYEIIWVVGKDGNEGKSWFQKYVKSVFGTRKVGSGIDFKSNSASIFQGDIFLLTL